MTLRVDSRCTISSTLFASVLWTAAMDISYSSVIDVTNRLAEALPDFLPDWASAKVYVVSGQATLPPIRASHCAGGLSAGTLRRINEYVERQLSDTISLHDLALVAGLSDCHFARAFKQSVGMPPHRYIMHRRVDRATVLILTTDRPLSQIALEVGFCDQSHFSRLIARATGQTPRKLRRESFGPADEKGPAGVVAIHSRTTVQGRPSPSFGSSLSHRCSLRRQTEC
jgi:AraC-like DNA-binding protein